MVTERPGAGPWVLTILLLGGATIGLFVLAKNLRDEKAHATADVPSVRVSVTPPVRSVATTTTAAATLTAPPTIAPADPVEPTPPPTAVATVTPPTVATPAPPTGGGFRQTMTDTINKAKPRFKSCYEAGLTRNPDLAGTVKVSFTVDKSGKVTQASDAGSTLADAGVLSCMRGVFRSLTFSPPDTDSATVTYPMTFAPPE